MILRPTNKKGMAIRLLSLVYSFPWEGFDCCVPNLRKELLFFMSYSFLSTNAMYHLSIRTERLFLHNEWKGGPHKSEKEKLFHPGGT